MTNFFASLLGTLAGLALGAVALLVAFYILL